MLKYIGNQILAVFHRNNFYTKSNFMFNWAFQSPKAESDEYLGDVLVQN